MIFLRTILLAGLLASTGPALADEPRPAITLRLDHPDRQVRSVLDLFRGAKAPHPAAALAAWKRASREPGRLGKPAEALIAFLNPAMAGELRTLDAAEFALWFEPESGRPDWAASLPGDDGSFAALATALVLSGGAAVDPVDGLAVDRLGPPGAPVMARGPRALLVAGSASGLEEAKARSGRPEARDPGDRLRFAAEPGSLAGSKSLLLRRVQAALGEALGPVAGSLGLEGPTLTASVRLDVARPGDEAVVDPAWLGWLPTDRSMAAFALAIDPSPAGWDAAFRLLDRVERVDPARGDMAPASLRLGLLARALGIRLDADLRPHLRGVAGWLGADGSKLDRAFLMLHLDDEAVAGRIYDRVQIPGNPAPPEGPGAGRRLGRVEGRPLRLHRFGRSIAATWGEGVVEASLDARDHPERSAASLLPKARVEVRPGFFAATWPGRVPGLIPVDTPLAVALAEGPPMVWSGGWEGPRGFRGDGAWPGLDEAVRRFLDLLPLDPPPDH